MARCTLTFKILVRILYKFANFLAIVPSYHFEKMKILYPKRDKIWSMIVAIVLIVGYKEYAARINNRVYPSISYTLQAIHDMFFVLFFTSLFLKSNWSAAQSWVIMLNNLQQIDRYLCDKKNKFSIFKSFHFYLSLSFVVLLIVYAYVFIKFYIIYKPLIGSSNIILLVLFSYEILIGTLILNLIITFKLRYRKVRRYLENNLHETPQFMSIVRKFETLLKLLSASVECFNRIFGWPLTLLMSHIVVLILLVLKDLTKHTIKSIHFEIPKGPQSLVLIAIWIKLISNIILLISIIIYADLYNIEIKKLELRCFTIRTRFNQQLYRNELVNLSNLCKESYCKISAANFFDITKGTLLGILSTITTYFIVILQLPE